MNPTLVVALKAIAYLAFAVLASPLIEGVMRKIKAVIHSRKGPPIRQPYLDLAKLLVKEDLSSQSGLVARLAPPAAFASVLTASFFVPFGVGAPAGGAGDLFLFIYLITLSSACIMAGALTQASPFSHVGGAREMMMVLTVEAVLVISLLIVGISGRSALLTPLAGTPFRFSFLLGLFCYFFAMQAMLGKLPFDIAEAEQEIMGGPFIEYSGPSLALFKWTFYMKQLVFASLFLNLFIGLPRIAVWGALGSLVNFAINFVGVLVVAVLVVLVDATNPRLRIDQSMRFFAGLIGVSLVGVGLAAFGL
jgi:formate hydrogenlyase subunit 4